MLKENSQFSHFTIIRQIGSGGMGQVFLAEDQKLGRQVALKILQSDLFSDTEKKERFYREARTAARVTHANVMAVYDIDAAPIEPGHEPITFLVMEYVNGASLSDYLLKNRPAMSEVVRLAEKIASGLAEAHQLGIVHRDIKSDNILVTASREPKILDFGLAKAVDPVQWGGADTTATISKELTRAGKIVGTVSYMSPEQARGEAVDTRSDIFSFGILLYRMVTGVLPFDGTTQVSTLAKILETQPESPRLKNADVPPELESIIEKCLRKDPQDRYQNTQDLVVDLRNLRRKYDSGITETVSLMTDAVKIEKQKVPFALRIAKIAGITLVAMVAIAATMQWLRGRSETGSGLQASENRLAILSFENKTGDESLNWLQTGLPEILLTDLGQDLTLEVMSNDRLRDYLNKSGSTEQTFTQTQYREAARSLGVKTIVSGAYYKVDTLIRIDARIEDITSGKIISAEKVQGGKSNPFALVDSLTGKVLGSLNLHGREKGSSVESLLSSSPEAYRKYLEGMELFGDVRNEEAIAAFTEAIKLDTTFALAYMRAGMANVFSGKQQLGSGFIAKALTFAQKLPPRDKSKLDIYADVWVTKKYDAAFTKQEVFVKSYPDDKEGLSIYGLLLWEFRKDTTGALLYIDSALSLDPNYQMALGFSGQVYSQLKRYDKAIPILEKLVELAPESPSALLGLAVLYDTKGDFPAALKIYRQVLEKFPTDLNTITQTSWLFARQQQFDSARVYMEKFREQADNDPYRLIDYYVSLGSLASWEGKFSENIRFRKLALQEAKKTGDSALIGNSYRSTAVAFRRIEKNDSALYYLSQAIATSPGMNKLGLPLTLAEIDPVKYGDSARALYHDYSTLLKSRTPSELWPIFDCLGQVLEGIILSDTVKRVTAMEKILTLQQEQPTSGNNFELGVSYVKLRQYEKGIARLLPFVDKSSASGNAYYYLTSYYYMGVANEGLGNTSEAIKCYEEVLKHWGHADFEIKEIADTRARLQQLRG